MVERCKTDRKYRLILTGCWNQVDQAVRDQSKTQPQPAKEERVTLPCIYRSEKPIEYAACGCHVYDCEIHEKVVPWRKKGLIEGIKVCEECNERREFPPLSVTAIESDRYHALRSTLPPGIPTDAAMQTQLRVVSERRTAMPETMSGRGIVYAAGGWRFMCGVFVSVRMLRWLGCEYPVEVWYNGDLPGEFDPDYLRIFDGLGVTFHDAAAELRRLGITRRTSLGGWPLKPLAYLLSSFAEVLGLDADCYPVLDPRSLFDAPGYLQRGAILWPDKGGQHGAPLEPGQWQRFGLAPRQTPGIESGQVLIDKRRHWHSLAVTTWLNDHHDYCYLPHGPAGLYGDKDTFAIGFHAADEWGGSKTGVPYLQAPPTRWLHTAFMQHAPDGATMFIHRCRDKPRIERHSYGTSQRDQDKMIRCDHAGGKSPPFAHEWKVFDLVEEYRRLDAGRALVGKQIAAMKSAIAKLTDAPELEGRGIVTVTSPNYWPGTWVLLRMLQHVGCNLPVQIWYRANDGLPAAIADFTGVIPKVIDGDQYRQHQHTAALLECGWREILYIDSDAYPVADPTPCFADLADAGGGTITWQDHPDGDGFQPWLYGLPASTLPSTFTPQGGVKILDLVRAWRNVSLANWFCRNEDFYFPGQMGEQSQFRAAWELLGATPKRYSSGRVDSPHEGILVHQGRDGVTPLFIHRPGCKFAADGTFHKPALRYDDLPGESEAWGFFSEWADFGNSGRLC